MPASKGGKARPPRRRKKLRIFLSYGHDEYSRDAIAIKADLEKRGHEVWFDLNVLKAGRTWESYIEDGIHWCDLVLLLMTPHSIRRRLRSEPLSTDGFCLNEVAKAIERHKAIVPVMLVWVDQGPPTSICRIQWLDMTDCVPIARRRKRYATRFQRLIQALEDDDLNFEGSQAALLSVLKPLQFSAEIASHVSTFTGRQWLWAEFDEWLANPRASPVFWLVGGPGIGKTAIAAYLCHHRGEVVGYHLCAHGHVDKADPRQALLSIAWQLGTHFPEYFNHLQTLRLGPEVRKQNPATIFNNLIVEPFHGMQPPKGGDIRLIVIDALDEATHEGRNEIAELIDAHWHKLPSWLRLVITSRPETTVSAPLARIKPFVLDAEGKNNRDDVRRYLAKELPKKGLKATDSLVNQLVAKSEGMFLYAKVIVDELQDSQLSLTAINEFPQGISGYYQRFFERQFPDASAFRKVIRPALDAVTAQREPLSVPMLARAAGLTEFQLQQDCLTALGSLFPVRPATDETTASVVVPIHKSLIEWLTRRDKKTNLFQAGRFAADRAAGEAALIAACWAEYKAGPAAMSAYSRKHLAAHLVTAHEWQWLLQLTTDSRKHWIDIRAALRSVGASYGNWPEDFRLLLEGSRLVKAVFFRGETLEMERRFAEALVVYQQLQSIAKPEEEEYFAAPVAIATTYDRMNRPKAGLAIVTKVLATDFRQRFSRTYWRGKYQQGVFLSRLRQDREATRVLKEVILQDGSPEKAPELATSALYQLGVVDLNCGRLDAAASKFRKSLKQRGNNPFDHRRAFEYRRLGNVTVAKGQPDEARHYFEESLLISERCGDLRYAAKTRKDLKTCIALISRPKVRK